VERGLRSLPVTSREARGTPPLPCPCAIAGHCRTDKDGQDAAINNLTTPRRVSAYLKVHPPSVHTLLTVLYTHCMYRRVTCPSQATHPYLTLRISLSNYFLVSLLLATGETKAITRVSGCEYGCRWGNMREKGETEVVKPRHGTILGVRRQDGSG